MLASKLAYAMKGTMSRIRQFHSPKLSIWQSAMDEAIAAKRRSGKTGAPAQPTTPTPPVTRPDTTDPAVSESTAYCAAASGQLPPTGVQAPTPPSAAPSVAGAITATVSYCSTTALKLAKSIITCNQQDEQRYRDELGKFTDCDPLYAEAAEKYAEYFVAQGKKIPYRVYQHLDDFVIDGKLPDRGRVAIVGDWGTGLDAALTVLRQIAAKKPDVVIHLGDIYYSGTGFEVENYFHQPWDQILGLPASDIPTFTLAGNHDMYSGGVAYYNLIDQLGQPASYFCLRNKNWQFLAMDTGLHDSDPAAGDSAATYLEDTELAWHKDKMAKAGGRRTVVLSHHQLFTANESIDGHEVNLRLYPQAFPFLSNVALWLWGHEHNFVVYGPFMGLARGRCCGHGAFPMGVDETPKVPRFPDVPVITKDAAGKPIILGSTGGIYHHGYAIMDLDGAKAAVSYFQDSDEKTPLFQETIA